MNLHNEEAQLTPCRKPITIKLLKDKDSPASMAQHLSVNLWSRASRFDSGQGTSLGRGLDPHWGVYRRQLINDTLSFDVSISVSLFLSLSAINKNIFLKKDKDE